MTRHPLASVVDAIDAMTPLDVMAQHVGARLRLTWPNGSQRSGDVRHHVCPTHGLKPGAKPSEWDTFGGTMAGGELNTAVRIERMQPNGRYEEVWSA